MPATTPLDVILHLAYKRYIQDTTHEDIECMRIILDAYDMLRRVNERIIKFRLSERVPVADVVAHYKECIWSDPHGESGPDTCICCYLSGDCYTVLRLLDKLLTQDEDCTAGAEAKDNRHGL